MICPVHGLEFKTVPAGVSKKTGQPYNSFQSCPEMGCRMKPPADGSMMAKYTPPTPTEARPMVKNPSGDGFVKGADWDKIGQQKSRCLLMTSVLQGKELDWKIIQQAEAYVLTGKTPAELANPNAPVDLDDIASSIPF